MKKLMPLVLAMTFLVPTITLAGKGKGGGEGKEMARALKQLNLSEEQKKKLKEMRKANKEKKFESQGELKKLREEMKTKFASDAPESELKAIHAKIKSLRDQKAEARFQKMLTIRSVLTVEQRKKFQELQMGKRKGKKRKK